jgi:hypothetical protein
VITTNGNLHLDAGYSRDMYLNYYSYQAGNGGSIQLYSPAIYMPNIGPQTSYTGNILQIGSSAQICTAQFTSYRFSNRGNWGGGVSIGDFDKASTNSAVVMNGDASYYVSSGGNTEIIIRLYNSRTGGYYYYSYNQYTNVTYNHVNFPINHHEGNNGLPYGYYYVVMYLQGGSWNTDGNDYCNLVITVHP